MKNKVFWDVVPYSLVDIHQRFGEIICLRLQCRRAEVQYSSNLTIKVARSSKTSAVIHQNIRRHISEDSIRLPFIFTQLVHYV
jgi:hypothetical protein